MKAKNRKIKRMTAIFMAAAMSMTLLAGARQNPDGGGAFLLSDRYRNAYGAGSCKDSRTGGIQSWGIGISADEG